MANDPPTHLVNPSCVHTGKVRISVSLDGGRHFTSQGAFLLLSCASPPPPAPPPPPPSPPPPPRTCWAWGDPHVSTAHTHFIRKSASARTHTQTHACNPHKRALLQPSHSPSLSHPHAPRCFFRSCLAMRSLSLSAHTLRCGRHARTQIVPFRGAQFDAHALGIRDLAKWADGALQLYASLI